MRSKSTATGDGFVQDILPLVRGGFVVLRSILDILIDRIEEMEASRDIDVRRDIYASIIEALEAEIENTEKDEADTAAAMKIEALEAVISVLKKESDELKTKTRKKGKRPHKVKID